jgi:tetratricopeptide (TPR) repeat protein
VKKARRLLLIGWDAADWSILQPLLDAGEMPTLGRLVRGGVSGPLLAMQPLVPAAQWTSLATGKRPWQHRVCHGFESVVGANEFVAATASQRRSLALWEMLAQSGRRSLVVGWPATHGARADNLVLVSDRYAQPTAAAGTRPWPPAPSGTYWPEQIADHLNPLRVSPEDLQSDVVAAYIPDWKKIDQKRDRRLGLLRLFLASDFSHQTALVALLAKKPWDFAAIHFPALGAISQLFLPYRAPRQDWISESEFGLYQPVLLGACRMLDKMLDQLAREAGQNAALMVVSAHGVSQRPISSATLRSGNQEAWKSPFGIFVTGGPGFAGQAAVVGATVLDVTPTILSYFGLSIGDDMEGRVLLEGFAQAREVSRVASWEPVRAAAPPAAEVSAGDSSQAAALRRESDWNLARSFLEAGHQAEALPVLESLFRNFPERAELAQALFHCQLILQKLSEAAETLEVLLERVPPGIWSLLPRAELCVARKEVREARPLVNQAWNLRPAHPDAMRRLGVLLLRLREWSLVADLARQALKQDENEPLAWAGLAEARLRQRQPAEAEEAALRAIRLNYYLPEAHFVLARALISQGKWEQGRQALQTLHRLQPGNRAAALYSRRAGLGL